MTSGHNGDCFAKTMGPADQLNYYTLNLEDEATAAADRYITITMHSRPEAIEPDNLDTRTRGQIGDKHSGRNHQWTTKVYEQQESQ